ncbi:hypothetical protein AMECASPLE_039264 [Ameca splendens]|uniref:Uncharacterized protein n=1 Tax=Ameca splendens TaxID=208324 RepID=A0ABV0ZHN2_9TELE
MGRSTLSSSHSITFRCVGKGLGGGAPLRLLSLGLGRSWKTSSEPHREPSVQTEDKAEEKFHHHDKDHR